MKVAAWYHSSLRVATAVSAIALVFTSGIFSSTTAHIAERTALHMATVVGVSAEIEPTELNTRTAALTAREREVAEREAAVEQREIEVDLGSGGGQAVGASQYMTYVLSAVTFILLVLMVLNYALDFARARRIEALDGMSRR